MKRINPVRNKSLIRCAVSGSRSPSVAMSLPPTLSRVFSNGVKKIAIIGVGLIGGSIALGLKKKARFKGEIVGVCRTEKSLKTAIRMDVIDYGTKDVIEAVEDADLVVIAVPVGTIIDVVKKALKNCKKGTIIIDVGSTKRKIVDRIEKILPKDISFVGCHPMAGSQKSGVDSAKPDLFKDAVCFLIKTKRTNPQSISIIATLWRTLGASIAIVTPDKHDRIASYISHLPHIIAASLINFISSNYYRFSGKGIWDMTRIASSSPYMWRDICISNRDYMNKRLRGYIAYLKKIAGVFDRGDKKDILRIFTAAKKKRDKFKKLAKRT